MFALTEVITVEPTSTYDALKRHVYEPVTLALEGAVIKATLTDTRAEGTSDVSLSLRFDNPQYGYLASKLGSPIVLSVAGKSYSARLHAIHPEGVNHVALTARFK